ncbi:SH3 domain-containing protein [Devosia albogilva]|uniref:SH3 domain-containing protein n=1 Tax=Devosia albogilva TaxID=429726 RepID=A0ABW5QNE7_9HYPH
MLRTLLLACAAALSLLAGAEAAFAQVVEGEEHCVVNVAATDALNLREGPSARSRIWTALPYGRCGIIVTGECKGAWCPVEDGHHSGWVNSRYISMVSPARYCVANVPAGDRLNLRAFPSANSRILTSLARNQCEIAFLPYATGNWQKVRVTGYEGWVNRRYLSGQ